MGGFDNPVGMLVKHLKKLPSRFNNLLNSMGNPQQNEIQDMTDL